MILFLCILFFMNSRIGLCKKLGAGFLLVTLCLSFYFQIFNLVWHGFNPPSSFPYRYSFLFSFLLILTAWYSLEHLDAGTVRIWYPAAIAGVLIVSILVLMQKVSPGMTTGRYLLNAGIVFVSAIFLTAYIYCRVKCFSGGIGGHSKSKCIWIFININITNLSDKMVWFGERMAGKQVANTKKTNFYSPYVSPVYAGSDWKWYSISVLLRL